MKTCIATACLAALTAWCDPAAAAGKQAELAISATLKPSPCLLTMANGGHFSYGIVRVGELRQEGATPMPLLRTRLLLSCPAPMKLALEVFDNQPSQITKGHPVMYGLAPVNGIDIGYYFVKLGGDAMTGDGRAAHLLFSDEGAAWKTGYIMQITRPGRLISWARSETTPDPQPYAQVGLDVEIATILFPTAELPVQDELPLRGSATFEVNYL